MAHTPCYADSGRWTVLFEANGTVRTGPVTIRCGFWQTDVRFKANSTARGPCCVGSNRRMVRFGVVGTAHAPCLAGLGGRTLRFGVDGTARTGLLTVPCGFGWTKSPIQGGWHGHDWPAHHAMRVLGDVQSDSGQIPRPYCPRTLSCGFGSDKQSGSGRMARPVLEDKRYG